MATITASDGLVLREVGLPRAGAGGDENGLSETGTDGVDRDDEAVRERTIGLQRTHDEPLEPGDPRVLPRGPNRPGDSP
jgi:hypothetical protein